MILKYSDNGTHLFVPKRPCSYDSLLSDMNTFLTKKLTVTEISGGRKEVHIAGIKSDSWKEHVGQKYDSFLSGVQNRIKRIAQYAGYEDVEMSENVMILVGSTTQQPPHVDLQPGQLQAIMPLTENAQPTLAFGFNDPTIERPTVSEAYRMLQKISPASNSIYSKTLKFAPSLALPMEKLIGSMRPICENDSPVWKAGTITLCDHTVVHAGPQQDGQRAILFTTCTVRNLIDEAVSEHYDVNHQILPYLFVKIRPWNMIKY